MSLTDKQCIDLLNHLRKFEEVPDCNSNAINSALETLDDLERDILVLRAVKDIQVTDIAAKLNLPQTYTLFNLSNAKEKVVKYIKGL